MLTLPFPLKLALSCYQRCSIAPVCFCAMELSRFHFLPSPMLDDNIGRFTNTVCVVLSNSVRSNKVFNFLQIASPNHSQINIIINSNRASDSWCASIKKMHHTLVRGGGSSWGWFFSQNGAAMKIWLSNCLYACVVYVQTSVYLCDCQLRKTRVCPMRSTMRKFNYWEL